MAEHKVFAAEVKAVDQTKGIVTSLVSVFGNVDAQGDRVLPGAFDRTIMEWRGKMRQGQFLPVIYGHKDDPDFIVGKVTDLRATAEGLEVDEQFFMDKPKAASAFHAITEGVLPGSSFGYGARKAKRGADGVRDLAELALFEVGPTAYPANDDTRVLATKGDGDKTYTIEPPELSREVIEAFGQSLVDAFEAKAGRRISARTRSRIQASIDAHETAIAGLRALLEEDDTATPDDGDGKAEEPEVKAEPETVDVERYPALAAARAMFD